MTKNTEAKRQVILDSVLLQVPFDGWTDSAYRQGCKAAGLTADEAKKACPHGLVDIVEEFGNWTDSIMRNKIKAEQGFTRLRTRDKILFAVRARLEALTPHREAVRRLMLWYALPHHLPAAFARISKTVDIIWRAAGDTSTDYNFYTKRMLLSGVMKSTTLFWLEDETPNCAASWAFLERRIDNVLKLGRGISLVKAWVASRAA